MKRGSIELTVGVFVLAGILAVLYLTIQLGKMELLGDDYYHLKARFASVAGVNTGSRIEVAGVKVGQVSAITLNTEDMVAVVDLKIRNGVELPDDTIASVRTSGLIGDRFIKLSPGGSEETLKPGAMVSRTESSIDLEELISKYVFESEKK